jgi:hypothetical protein
MSTPNKNKTNFKTYEASTRLLAAVIATTKVKLDYAEIQKLFGESTASGIEWQFREIKNLGKAQKEAVKNGQNPAALPVVGTPSAGRGRRGGGAGARTPGSGATAKTPGTGTTTTTTAGKRGRKTPLALPPIDSSDDDSSDVEIETPSNRASKRPRNTADMASANKKANGYTTSSTTTTTATTTPAPALAPVPVPVPVPVSRPALGTSIPSASFEAPAFAAPATSARPSLFGNGNGNGNGFAQGWDDFVADDDHLFAPFPEPTHAANHRPATIKKELKRSIDPYAGAFDAGDYFEDGEI